MMNVEEALVVLDAALEDNFLNNLQEMVFRQAWEGKTYSQIAEDCGYEANYIKNVGYKLWSLLSTVFAEEVTKSNFRAVIRRHYHEQFNAQRVKSMEQLLMFERTTHNLVENAKAPTRRVALVATNIQNPLVYTQSKSGTAKIAAQKVDIPAQNQEVNLHPRHHCRHCPNSFAVNQATMSVTVVTS